MISNPKFIVTLKCLVMSVSQGIFVESEKVNYCISSLAFVYMNFSFGTRGTQNMCINHYNTYLMWKTCMGKLTLLDFQRIII